jgi:Ca2+-binding EF-hand superfamily protein
MLKKIVIVIFIIVCISGCACLRQERRLKRSVWQIEKNFEKIDTNHDGSISREELMAAK